MVTVADAVPVTALRPECARLASDEAAPPRSPHRSRPPSHLAKSAAVATSYLRWLVRGARLVSFFVVALLERRRDLMVAENERLRDAGFPFP
jgi:hypothetical protein